MSLKSCAAANSRPPALPTDRTETSLLPIPHTISVTGRKEVYFGQVERRSQCISGLLAGAYIPTPSSSIAMLTDDVKTVVHDPHPELERSWHRMIGDRNHKMSLGTEQTVPTYDRIDNRAAITSATVNAVVADINSSRSPADDNPPSMWFEHVKKLLEQHEILAARRALEIGLNFHPRNPQIASLLKAIAPGRVSPTGQTESGRALEIDWIKRHGRDYRGKWIALEKDRLIACGSTLSDLLASLDTDAQEISPLFVQHFPPE